METKMIRAAIAAICTAAAITQSFAATCYKVGADTSPDSSLAGNISSKTGWSTTQGASSTVTVVDFENSDFIVDSAKQLRTAQIVPDLVFGGRSLTSTTVGLLTLKKQTDGGTRKVTVQNMVIAAGGPNH
jgi:hypothetical protein